MASERVTTGRVNDTAERAAELFSAHGDFLLNVFKKELCEQDARDLWQNLFLSLITHPVPEDIPNMRSYLYRAAVNDIIDFKRSQIRQKQKIQEYTDMVRQQEAHHTPLRGLIAQEALLKAFKKIEADLPPAVGQALLHKYSNNFSCGEIAEHMNIKKKTAYRYLSVGTKMMEQFQEQVVGDEHGRS